MRCFDAKMATKGRRWPRHDTHARPRRHSWHSVVLRSNAVVKRAHVAVLEQCQVLGTMLFTFAVARRQTHPSQTPWWSKRATPQAAPVDASDRDRAHPAEAVSSLPLAAAARHARQPSVQRRHGTIKCFRKKMRAALLNRSHLLVTRITSLPIAHTPSLNNRHHHVDTQQHAPRGRTYGDVLLRSLSSPTGVPRIYSSFRGRVPRSPPSP